MEKRRLGNSDLELTVIGLGCWLMGGEAWHDVRDEESERALHAALDAGINWLDTAEVYGRGHSERIIGRVLAARRREEVIVATKVVGAHLAADQLPGALDQSLRNLRTDYVDLYQVHWPNAQIPIEETMAALLAAQEAGKIRYIGVSNFNARQIAEALQYGPVVSLQPPYSLFWRYIEKETLPFCREHNIGVIPYSPLAQGLLTGKFSLSNRPPADDNRAHNRIFLDPTYEVALQQVEVVRQVAARYGKTPAQVAIRWVLQQPGITAAIVGARNERQVAENLGADGWTLAPEDMATLTAAGDKVMASLGLEEDTPMWKWD